MNLKVDDVVLCRVVKIEGATVFLAVEGLDVEGSMMLSEVAAGRIRNLREYVSLNRTVVCKVLKISGKHVEFSLRRVTAKEKEEVLERYKREKAFSSMLKVVGSGTEEVIEKIKEKRDFVEFFEEARENPKILEEYLGKERAEKVGQILAEKEDKKKTITKIFFLQSFSGSGVKEVQQILEISDVEIHYLGSSKFSISVSAGNFREVNAKLTEFLNLIEKRAKEKKVVFEVVKEK